MKLAALALIGLLAASPEGTLVPPDRIVATSRDGEQTSCTVVVQDESLRQVLEELTEQLGIVLEGFDGVERNALISAELRDRPLRQVLEYVLGSVGLRYRLRTDALTILEGGAGELSPDELLQLASAAYLRAQSLFPAHPLAADARLSQGRIEELRGNWTAALEHFQVIREKYSTSPRMAEAIFRAGEMHGELGQWSEASLTFRELVNLQTGHDFQDDGLLELARSLIRLGDPRTALSTLTVLDRRFPTGDPDLRIERMMLRADALLGSGQPIDGLRILEKLESSALDAEDQREVHRLRARSFESLGMASEAARAWLLFAQRSTGADRDGATLKAAELALREGDELAVLFIASKVESPGLAEKLAPYVREANDRLGLVDAEGFEHLTVEERLHLADGHLAKGRPDAAKKALEDLLPIRDSLPHELRVRLTLTWSQVLEADEGWEAAIAFLSEERSEFEELSDRSRIDVRAADLFEEYGTIEQAIAAFEGDY